MNQEEFLETARKYQELMDKLGIVSKTWSSRDSFDPNIPFSEMDSVSILTTEYNDGRKDIVETPMIYSHLMFWCKEVMEEWGYIYDPSYKASVKFLVPEFRFQHDELPSIYIKHNSVHRNMFKIADDNNRTIESKHTWKILLDKHIKYLIEKSGSTKMRRELKLRELID